MKTFNLTTYVKCTQAEYEALENKDANTMYITTDTQKFYIGNDEIGAYNNTAESFYGQYDSNLMIVKSFTSIANMQTAFAQGANYTDVQYGQYVIISSDTVNGNLTPYEQDNGKVYKRILESPGYEYVFRITGPAGAPSILNIQTMSEINEYATNNNLTLTSHTATLASDDLVPGKIDDNTFNDGITWKYYQKEQGGQLQTYMGIQLPYPTINFSAEYADISQPVIIDQDADNKIHPFHSNFKLQIPKIPYGRSVDSLFIINAANAEAANVDFGDLDVNVIDDYKNRNVPILVYQCSEYNNGIELSQSLKFLSEFKPIHNIDISDEGYLRFYLTSEEANNNNNQEIVSSSLPVIPVLTGTEIAADGTLILTWTNPLKNTTFTTVSTGTKLPVTNDLIENNIIIDLIIYDSILYKRCIGLDQEISTITGVAIDQLSTENDTAINTLAGTTNTYHKDTTSNLWYKKLFDIRTLLNNQSQNNGT